jgi:hypothetical protein
VENDFGNQKESQLSDYHAEPKTVNQQSVRVVAKMQSDLLRGELVLAMRIKNNSRESIKVDYTNCALNIDKERVVVPEVARPYKSIIPYDDSEEYEIHFHPINSIEFFNGTSYRGDMKQQYSLDLNFITGGNGKEIFKDKIVFQLTDSVYQNYLRDHARQQAMHIFTFDFDSATFDDHEVSHLDKISFQNKTPDETAETILPVVYSLNPAMTINRMIFNIYAYKAKDTLIVYMRMLNEDSYPLKVIPKNCCAKISGVVYEPIDIFSDSFKGGRLPDDAYIFRSGTRLHLRLKYLVPHEIDRWTLSNDWLLVSTDRQKKWDNLLFTDFAFRESAITKKLLK